MIDIGKLPEALKDMNKRRAKITAVNLSAKESLYCLNMVIDEMLEAIGYQPDILTQSDAREEISVGKEAYDKALEQKNRVRRELDRVMEDMYKRQTGRRR